MSKAVGSIFGTGSTGAYGYENNYVNYLNNYDTSNYDNTLKNMTSTALNMSNNLGALPNYQFSVNASDDARKRMENATYQSYVDKLTPQFQQQINDLETSLANKGIPIGSEAYQRAMTDAQNNFNNALNQAAYQSVINGQQAYSQSLADSINSANFSNNAQQSYIDQILSLLENSVSGYQKQSDIYNVNAAIKQRQAQAEQSGWNNLIGSAVTAGRLYSGMPK